MKKSLVVLIAAGGLLSGCVGYEVQSEPTYRDSTAYRYDRDGDGVRNSQDQRPDDARRY